MTTDPAATTAAPFEPGRYPRTYRFSGGTRWTLVVLAIAVVAIAVFIASPARFASDDRATRIVLMVLLGALAIWLVAMGNRTRLVLSADSLAYRGAVVSRHIPVAHVLGRRRPANSRRAIQIVPRPGHGPKFQISGDLTRDAWFDAWFERIPDLDAAEHAASLARVLEDRTLGATPRDVTERLVRATWLARIGGIGAILTPVALLYGPIWWNGQADVDIAMCLPIVAIVAAALYRGLVTLSPPGTSANDARPSLFPMILLPSFALLVRLMTQSNMRAWQSLVAPAVVGGALGAALALALDPGLRKRIGAVLGVMASMGLLAAAAVIWLDVRIDPQAVQPVRVSVTGWQFGKGVSGTVFLGPAPTSFDWRDMQVRRREMSGLQVGTIACLSEHPGLLGLRWAEVHRCADDPPVTPEEAAHRWLARIARPASQRPALAQQLVAGDWQSVDAELNGVQKRFEKGEATAIDVEQAFIPLYNVEPALDAPLADWLVHAPNSWAAHVAMALHAERQIEWLSSAGFGERNSPGFNWEERTRFALGQARTSMALSSRPALSLMVQYRLTPRHGNDRSDWVDQMVAIDPEDVTMRREYLIQHPICPCKGSEPDDPAMRQLLRSNPSPHVRDTLAAFRLRERGADAGNTRAAVELYTRALALHPYPQDAYDSRINTAVALIEWNRLDEAATQLRAAIATLPGNRHAHEELGYVYELQKKMPQALAEFLVDAERGQSWAQMRAGSFMLTPEAGVPLDRQAGAFWMRRAANAGQERARDILHRHPDLMVAYPPT